MKTPFHAYPMRGVNAMPFVAMLLYALMVTPMVIELRTDLGEELRAHARIRVWRLAFRFDARLRRGEDGLYVSVHEESRSGKDENTMDVRLRAMMRLILQNSRARRFMLSRVRLHELTACVRIGTGDAAYTAWLGGALTALAFPLGRWMNQKYGVRPHMDLRCDWEHAVLIANVQGIIALLPGDIMAALVLAAARKLRKEARKRWTGIPLRA